jgi:hypothetical protein
LWTNDNIDRQTWIEIKDVDHDGEDELIFTPRPDSLMPAPPAGTHPILAKGANTFR